MLLKFSLFGGATNKKRRKLDLPPWNMVGRENVIAGTDCGFSQNWNTIRVHPSIQWAKLQSLAEGARLASRDLWARK